MEILTKSAQETKDLGQEFANCLKGGIAKWRVIGLTGELGAGKTTFVQGLAKGLGIDQRILSSTFIMIRQYKIPDQRLPVKNFYHVDLYRVENKKDVEGLGLEEIFNDKKNIVAIEWAEKIKKILPAQAAWVNFEYQGQDKRRIVISD